MRPALFAEKRSALISEMGAAENGRRVAADALAAAETAMAETDRAAKISLEALSAAREATARAEERMEGTKRRLGDIEREIHDGELLEHRLTVGAHASRTAFIRSSVVRIPFALVRPRRERHEPVGLLQAAARSQLEVLGDLGAVARRARAGSPSG